MGLLDLFNEADDKEFNIGDKVRVKYRGQEGYVIGYDGTYYQVSINNGQIVERYKAFDLEEAY